ncbi:Bacterioopsin transcriptional activator [Thermoplasmatales archaeon]|nr:Bacterioopsin transcriptional activator [Thermoplasmatales archaeon]
MEAWEISFRIKYDYPFIQMSNKYPGVRISMWCVWEREMLHVPLDHEDLMSELEGYADSINLVIENHKRSNDGTVLTMKCSCDVLNSVWNVVERNNCSIVHPAVYLDGWGYFRVISFSEDSTKKLFVDLSRMGQNELLGKKIVHIDSLPSTIWVESFFERLTDRQAEAVVKAFDYGYYASPREVTTDSIATSLGITRSTYEEHLRKAENRLMDALIPYLKLFNAGRRKKNKAISSQVEPSSAGD